MRHKVTNLNRIVQNGLLFSGWNWSKADVPTGVKDHVMELLIQMVCVHNELFCSYASLPQHQIIPKLVEGILQEYLDSLFSFDTVDENAIMQLDTDVHFIAFVMINCFTKPASNLLGRLTQRIQQWKFKENHESTKFVVDILINTIRKTRTVFSCFQ